MPELAGYSPGWSYINGRTQVPALSADTVSTIMIISDSMAASTINSVLTPGQVKNHNLSIYNGGVYQTLNPMLSCGVNTGNLASSSVMSPLADALIGAGTKQRIVGVPCGVGGSLTANWALYTQGNVAGRIQAAKNRIESVGLTISAIIAILGANDNPNGTSLSSLNASWTQIIANIRATGYLGKVFVPTCSMFGGAISTTVQTAQANIRNGTDVLDGGNLDTGVTSGNRWDGTHFNSTGAALAAGILQTAITPYL